MQNENVIQILDKVNKLLYLGNIPQAHKELEGSISLLSRLEEKKKGKILLPCIIEQSEDPKLKEIKSNINQIIKWINERFSH